MENKENEMHGSSEEAFPMVLSDEELLVCEGPMENVAGNAPRAFIVLRGHKRPLTSGPTGLPANGAEQAS